MVYLNKRISLTGVIRVGIFSNKQQDNLQDGAAQPAEQVHPVNTDGVLSGAAQQPAPNPQPVPAASNDAGSYIVTDTPVQSSPAPALDSTVVDVSSENVPSVPSSIPVVESPAVKSAADTAPEVEVPGQAADQTAPEVTSMADTAANTPSVPVTGAASISDDLSAIKQEALAELSPIVDHLEQPPEDKFNTTMMLLQSTDDKNLIKVAYEAAKSIPDEKIRARALLDIVNEINYFTQNKSS